MNRLTYTNGILIRSEGDDDVTAASYSGDNLPIFYNEMKKVAARAVRRMAKRDRTVYRFTTLKFPVYNAYVHRGANTPEKVSVSFSWATEGTGGAHVEYQESHHFAVEEF